MARRLRLAATMASAAALFAAIGPAPVAAQTPAPDAVPGELIVRFKSTLRESQREAVRNTVGAELEEKLPVKGLELVDLAAGMSVAAAERSFERQSEVLYAEPNFYRHAAATPADPMFGSVWGLNNTGQPVLGRRGTADADIDAPEAWELTKGSPTVIVAVVDTGVAYDHQDLAPNVWTNPGESGAARESNGRDDDGNGRVDDVRGWDFAGKDNDPRDGNGHGTHVAGTIGARGDDGYGVSGVAWDTSLMPVQVLGANGSGSVADVVAGYAYAAQNGADVVNASLGGSSSTQAEREAIQDAPDTLFVVAAGNDGRSNEDVPQYPCNYSLANVICVAATNSDDELASFSNFGSTSVDLAAPGDSTLSSYPRCVDATFPYSHAYLSGTSMATPHVAGAAALVLSRSRTATLPQVRERLLASVDPIAALATKTVTGGRLNAHAALVHVSPTTLGLFTADPPRGSQVPVAEPSCPVTPSSPAILQPAAAPVMAPAPPPAPSPSVPSVATPGGDVFSPQLSVSLRARQRLSRVLAVGLQPVVRCSEACRISTDVLVDRPTARRLAVTSVIGRASAGLSRAGGRKVAVRLTSAAKRRLARVHLVTLTLRTRGVDRAGNARTVTKRLSLRR